MDVVAMILTEPTEEEKRYYDFLQSIAGHMDGLGKTEILAWFGGLDTSELLQNVNIARTPVTPGAIHNVH